MENQGSNYKHEVMEALDSVPANRLSGAAFKWAASHLPDEGKQKGSFDLKVKPLSTSGLNHDQNSVLAVFGFDDPTLEPVNHELAVLMKRAFEDPEITRNSEIVELILKEGSEQLMQVMVIQGIMSGVEVMRERLAKRVGESLPEDLLKSLKDLGDFLKGLKDKDSDK